LGARTIGRMASRTMHRWRSGAMTIEHVRL